MSRKPWLQTQHHARAAGRSDAGMAMAIALLMGLMLSLASGGLLAKQLMLRRLNAAETYKQLAEMAASSGMNRLLAALNNTGNNTDQDISYLWELSESQELSGSDSQQQQLQQWQLEATAIRPLLSQPCQPAGSVDPEALELLNGDLNASGSLINDGRRQQVQASYRLRSYTSNGNTGTVEIEGYASSEQGQTVLSRSLLTRMLALEEAVIDPTHWGVLAARQLTLGSSSLSGPGVALWLMDRNEASSHFNSSSSCSNAALAAATGSSDPSMQAALWPRAGDGDLFPPTELFADHNVHSEELQIDTRLAAPLSRSGDSSERPGSVSRNSSNQITAITLHSEHLCEGQNDRPCLVKISNLRLTAGVPLSVETGEGDGTKPVILQLLNENASLDLSGGQLCQAAASSSVQTTLPCSGTGAKAERLVILASTGDGVSGSCSSSSAQLVLNGDSLPAAVVLMPQGTTTLTGPSSMRGLLWSHRICAAPGLALNSNNADGSSVTAGFRSLWADSSFQFGRTSWRGVRGRRHDVFRRW